MKPVDFPEANTTLNPHPADEGKVLPMRIFKDPANIVSCWEFSDEDLLVLKENGNRVYVVINGPITYPLLLTPVNPFKNEASGISDN